MRDAHSGQAHSRLWDREQGPQQRGGIVPQAPRPRGVLHHPATAL